MPGSHSFCYLVIVKTVLLSVLGVLLIMAVYAQQQLPGVSYITGTSTVRLEHHWRFMEADSAVFALPEYDDSGWDTVRTGLPASNGGKQHGFGGIGWFRLRIALDSQALVRPLALAITHWGASEIYLDGKLIQSYGIIDGKEGSAYYDPQNTPFLLPIQDTYVHVLAVRYANYEASRNYRVYWTGSAGFEAFVGEADHLIANVRSAYITVLVITLLMAIFFTLGGLHFFLFIFQRSELSNLYFSIFGICVGALFMSSYIAQESHDPLWQLRAKYGVVLVVATAFLALSAFVHHLFLRKGRLLFYVIILLYTVLVVARICNADWAVYLLIVLIAGVSLEAIVAIIIAMVKKRRGARILGTGILFFAVVLLSVFIIAMINGGVIISGEDIISVILQVFVALAILSIPGSMSVYLAWNFGAINKDLAQQLEQVKILSKRTLEQEQEKQRLLEIRREELERLVDERTWELQVEKKKSDDLLRNILPEEVAEELKNKGSADARLFDEVTVLFTDFVNFSKLSENLSPKALVAEIDKCFKAFDEISGKYGLEKIKTIGDAYLAVAGIPQYDPDHAVKAIQAAVAMRDYITEYRTQNGIFEIRIGLHSGPVVAGIVGVKKFAYDIWGDTVNTAARMEQHGEAGKINISGVTRELAGDHFIFKYRGKVPAKNKGEIDMYFVQ